MNPRWSTLLSLAVLSTSVALVPACTQAATPAAATASPVSTTDPPAVPTLAEDATLGAQVREAVAPAPFGRQTLPGAIILVADGLRVLSFSTHGVARLGAPGPPDRSASSRIGSITKTFVAAAVLQLIDAGTVSLSTAVDALGLGLDGLAGIRIEHLLTMRSGLHTVDETVPKFAQEVRGWWHRPCR
jgi:D-alanyl-D-alanine carboxypeptidase